MLRLDPSVMDETIQETRLEVNKVGRMRHAIPRYVEFPIRIISCDDSFSRSPPRFCDFVNGTSEQLEAVFLDIRKLYFNPGFVLQQCAYINNSAHFSKIIENPNVTEEDVGYVDEDCGGDNPIMIAAR